MFTDPVLKNRLRLRAAWQISLKASHRSCHMDIWAKSKQSHLVETHQLISKSRQPTRKAVRKPRVLILFRRLHFVFANWATKSADIERVATTQGTRAVT